MADPHHAGVMLGFVACLALFLVGSHATSGPYQPNWESLDNRPLPGWYDEAKFGIFIHWGVFSVPAFKSEWFWNYWNKNHSDILHFMHQNYRPDFTYGDFAAQFTAEFYDPNEWAKIFKASGAKYVVLTTKHHEGFTLWPSKVSFNWNAMDVGPKRDLVGELAKAIRNDTGIRFGVYHSLFEWFNPLFLEDKKNNFRTRNYAVSKGIPELYELVNTYKPDVVWSDGDPAPAETYWNSTGFLAWLYNESPVKDTVVVNDRWGDGCHCKHGGYWTCNDRYNPGKLQAKKWENCMTIDCCSWGYRRDAQLKDYLTTQHLIKNLIETVSCGGNLLLNVGPTHDGRILPIFEDRLRQMGEWLAVNGEAIYSTKPWSYQNDTLTKDVWYTSKKTVDGTTDIYATTLVWPKLNRLTLGAPATTSSTTVTLLGYATPIKWKPHGTTGMDIVVPSIDFNAMPCQWAWVFKLTHLAN